MVSVKNGIVTTNPIAGTRPRANDEEDAALASDLLSDEKETAEHRMLVDSWDENDIGRIAENSKCPSNQVYGSGTFPLCHAFDQRVVKGRLLPELTAMDALKRLFQQEQYREHQRFGP